MLTDSTKDGCTGGIVFRFHRNSFSTARGFHFDESLKILKRKSCKCPKCQYLMDTMAEDISCGYLPDRSKLENGKVYRAYIKVTSRDFETGYADGWEWCFIEEE